MQKKYSWYSLLKAGLANQDWDKAIPSSKPKSKYDVIIIGGGGHGLATAYYLAKECGITNVAVVEKGYIGGGNTGRNTTIIRSNYLRDEASSLYEHSMRLWEGLSEDLNFNVMFSQRGVYNLGHTLQDMRDIERRVNANVLNGVDAVVVDHKEIKEQIPIINTSKNVRYPIMGASFQARAGVARHDGVAWGFARAASNLGVDIIQNCEVIDIEVEEGRVKGVKTTQGDILADRVGCVSAGHSSVIARMAGLRLPVESHPLQAFVSEAMKPILHTVVMSNAVHGYVSQSDKGDLVIGAGIDGYNSYAQRGNLPIFEHVADAAVTMFPNLSRLKLLRNWGGIMDMSMDGSPIICKGPIPGLYLNAGWCYGGFKATPAAGWCFAHTIAKDEPHSLNAGFTLDRFYTGHELDEKGVGPYPAHQ